MAGRKPITQCTDSEWRELTRRMAAAVSPPEGYRWRFVWSRPRADAEHNALAELKPADIFRRAFRPAPRGRAIGTALIRVDRGMSYGETAERLIHEVAHIFDVWTHHGWAADHSATWGVWYARIYCRFWGVS